LRKYIIISFEVILKPRSCTTGTRKKKNKKTNLWASFNIEVCRVVLEDTRRQTYIHSLPCTHSTRALPHTTHKNDITLPITYSLCMLSWKLDMK